MSRIAVLAKTAQSAIDDYASQQQHGRAGIQRKMAPQESRRDMPFE